MSPHHFKSGVFDSEYLASSLSTSRILEELEVYKHYNERRHVPQGEVASSNTGSSSLPSGHGDASNGEDGENFNDHGKRFHYDGHGKSYDKSGESKGTLGRDGLGEDSENGGSSGTIGASGTGGNPGSDNDCGCGVPTSFYISNTNPRVPYTGLWVLERATDLSITHSTVVQGSTASLRFKGSAIGVFGTVPASSPELEPPTVAYCLDSLPPYITTLPHATADMLNQPLYTSPNLSSNEEHLLVINVTNSMPRAPPYALAGFSLSPNGSQSSGSQGISPTTTPPMTTPPTTTPTPTVTPPTVTPPTVTPSPVTPSVPASATMSNGNLTGIVAGILGCLVFVFIVGIIICLVSRWRTHVRRELPEEPCPETSSRPETVYSNFTTSESILRHEPSIWNPTPEHVSFDEARTQVSRPGEILQPSDLLWPSDFAQPRAVRLSAIEFACPSVSSASTATLD